MGEWECVDVSAGCVESGYCLLERTCLRRWVSQSLWPETLWGVIDVQFHAEYHYIPVLYRC